jgi:hypothetical protein
MKPTFKTAITLLLSLGVFLFTLENSHARKIMREADCGKNSICMETFKKQKEVWLQCLKIEGISEKKRKKLSAKVEVLGIRNLKKQEVFIFDSRRKQCHKLFYEALSEIPQEGNRKPAFPLVTPGVLPGIP